jgi:hypothetical protein
MRIPRQQVLTMSTKSSSMRSEVFGWSVEDGALVKFDKPIGLTGSPEMGWKSIENPSIEYSPDCPLRALGCGWWLLAPPREVEEGHWEWWFVRPSPVDQEVGE